MLYGINNNRKEEKGEAWDSTAKRNRRIHVQGK